MTANTPLKRASNPRRWFIIAMACFDVLPIACSGGHPNELTARSTEAIVDGSVSPDERDYVVFIRANHGDGNFDDCTGTLLSPHVVLTAKHCVNLIQAGPFECTGAGTLVDKGQSSGMFGPKIEPSNIEIHTGTAPADAITAHGLATFASESGDACHDDIAAIVLDTPIQQSYPMLRATRPVLLGETVRLVGYGNNHDALIERHEIADVPVIDVGRDDAQDPIATTPARSFVVGGSTLCFGDSGGPALSMADGAVMGVYSRITGDCLAVSTRNIFVLASSFMDLFAPAFAQAGEQPLLEPGPATTITDAGTATDAGTMKTGTGGSAAMPEPVVSSRYRALRCSLDRSKAGVSLIPTAWFLLTLIVGFSLRRFAGRPF